MWVARLSYCPHFVPRTTQYCTIWPLCSQRRSCDSHNVVYSIGVGTGGLWGPELCRYPLPKLWAHIYKPQLGSWSLVWFKKRCSHADPCTRRRGTDMISPPQTWTASYAYVYPVASARLGGACVAKKCAIEPHYIQFVEVKGPGDQLSHKQLVWLSRLLSWGCQVEVCRVRGMLICM